MAGLHPGDPARLLGQRRSDGGVQSGLPRVREQPVAEVVLSSGNVFVPPLGVVVPRLALRPITDVDDDGLRLGITTDSFVRRGLRPGRRR